MLTGTVAGVYVGMEYGVGRVRGTRDWVLIFVIANFFTLLINLLVLYKLKFLCFRFLNRLRIFIVVLTLGSFHFNYLLLNKKGSMQKEKSPVVLAATLHFLFKLI